jgi:hypothetical protein
MSSLNKSLGEYLGIGRLPMPKKTISNQLFYGHVLDVIFNEDSIWYNGADSVGAVRVRILPTGYNKYEEEEATIAYPLDRTNYRVPLPGETIILFASFGPAVQGVYQNRYYYWKILTTDSNLTYSGLPFTGTDVFHLKPGPKILVTDADKKAFAKRFDDKLGIDKDLLADKSSLQQPRLGERTIESRFGSMIKFSSTPSNQAIWDEETQVNNALASTEGDPLLIINVDRKVVGAALTLKDISVDKTKGDDSNMFLTTTQNVPISLGCSARMLSWDVDLRAGIIDTRTGALANLATEMGGGFDANGKFKIALKGDIQFTEANFDNAGPSADGVQVGGAVGTSTAAKNGAPHYVDGTAYQRAWSVNGFKYGLGNKINDTTFTNWIAAGSVNNGTFSVDCSGFVAFTLGLSGGTSESQMAGSNNLTAVVALNASTLQAGDVVGADHGPTDFDGGRKLGIDHIAVVIQDPATKALYLAESHGGHGVRIRTIAEGVNAWNTRMAKNLKKGTTYVDDTTTPPTVKTYTHYVGNYRPSTTPTA